MAATQSSAGSMKLSILFAIAVGLTIFQEFDLAWHWCTGFAFLTLMIMESSDFRAFQSQGESAFMILGVIAGFSAYFRFGLEWYWCVGVFIACGGIPVFYLEIMKDFRQNTDSENKLDSDPGMAARELKGTETQREALALYMQGRFAEAFSKIDDALGIFEEAGLNSEGKALCLLTKGEFFLRAADFENALALLEKSHAIVKGDAFVDIEKGLEPKRLFTETDRILGKASIKIGMIQRELGNQGQAFRFLKEGLAVFENSDEWLDKAEGYMELGKTYGGSGKLRKAARYFKLALNICKKKGHARGVEACRISLRSIEKMKDQAPGKNTTGNHSEDRPGLPPFPATRTPMEHTYSSGAISAIFPQGPVWTKMPRRLKEISNKEREKLSRLLPGMPERLNTSRDLHLFHTAFTGMAKKAGLESTLPRTSPCWREEDIADAMRKGGMYDGHIDRDDMWPEDWKVFMLFHKIGFKGMEDCIEKLGPRKAFAIVYLTSLFPPCLFSRSAEMWSDRVLAHLEKKKKLDDIETQVLFLDSDYRERSDKSAILWDEGTPVSHEPLHPTPGKSYTSYHPGVNVLVFGPAPMEGVKDFNLSFCITELIIMYRSIARYMDPGFEAAGAVMNRDDELLTDIEKDLRTMENWLVESSAGKVKLESLTSIAENTIGKEALPVFPAIFGERDPARVEKDEQMMKFRRTALVGKAKHLLAKGEELERSGNFKLARLLYGKALKIGKDLNNPELTSKAHGDLGNVDFSLGSHETSIENNKKAIAIMRETGDKVGMAVCYLSLSSVYDGKAEFRKAVEYCENALAIAKEKNMPVLEAAGHGNLGSTYSKLGRFPEALENFNRSLEIARSLGDKSGEAKCFNGMGCAFKDLGNYKEALQAFDAGLKALASIPPGAATPIEMMLVLNRTITINTAYSKIKEAERSNNDAGKDDGLLEVEPLLDEIPADAGNTKKQYKKILDFVSHSGDKEMELECHMLLCDLYSAEGRSDIAIEHAEKALEIIHETTGNLNAERALNAMLGVIHSEKNELKKAFEHFKRSIEIVERIGTKLVEEEAELGFYGQISARSAYNHMVALCWKQRNEAGMFEYIERSKSKAFRDMLAETHIEPPKELSTFHGFLLEREKVLLAEKRKAHKRRRRPGQDHFPLPPRKPGEMDNILKDLNELYDEIKKVAPEYASLRWGKSITLGETRDMLSRQKKKIALVEYYITRDALFILVITPRDVCVKSIEYSRRHLRKLCETYQREVRNTIFRDFRAIEELNALLIDPMSNYLTGCEIIYFIPYDILHSIPMHALELNGKPLITTHAVCYAPSASLIQFCKHKGSGQMKSCASFGVNAKKSREVADYFAFEARKVAELFDSEVYIDARAAKRRVGDIEKDIIHFACHGAFDRTDPLDSGLILHNSEVLKAREIFRRKFRAELVTLSACETGINKISPGDELFGLTRAFLYAGAPSVVAGLWAVNDRSTKDLMLIFYGLLKEGKDKATALREAQVEIMSRKEYSHPYYWAPFMLIGDWE